MAQAGCKTAALSHRDTGFRLALPTPYPIVGNTVNMKSQDLPLKVTLAFDVLCFFLP